MDLSNLTISMSLELSFLAGVLGGIPLLYGWLLEDLKPQESKRKTKYLQGSIFIFFNLLVPGIISYFLITKISGFLVLPLTIILLVIDGGLLGAANISLTGHKYLIRLGLADVFEEEFRKKVEERDLVELAEILEEIYGKDLPKFARKLFVKISQKTGDKFIWSSSFVAISTFFFSIKTFSTSWIIVIGGIVVYHTLILALVKSANDTSYSDVTLVLEPDKKEQKGKLISLDENYVVIRQDLNLRKINRNKIIEIRQELWPK